MVACLIVASIFVTLRTGACWFKNRRLPLTLEDIFMYFALSSFAISSALYLHAIPTLYNLQLVGAGLMTPYAAMSEDTVTILKEFLAGQIFRLTSLWAVKLSLLFMFKRLTTGLLVYTRIWWVVVIFSVLVFIGCLISYFTECSSIYAYLLSGQGRALGCSVETLADYLRIVHYPKGCHSGSDKFVVCFGG